MNCHQCGADLPTGSAFCLQCGAQVGEVPTSPEDQLLVALEKAIGSQYEIVRLLGRGGMGAVYLGRDRALDRLVAVKVLPPESTDAESIERFRREARTAAKLTHPNIVPLYTFGEGEGILYFVMGYVPGESLRDRIKRLGRIEVAEARRILVEIAGALHYAHEQNVVHRDVKPDNILLEDETGKPMLTDFGVAKMTVGGETLTALGTALGTPYYMSPEQAAGEKEIDGRADLYSLGVIGYQMLAGQLPFEGDTVQDVLLQHMTKEPVAISTLAPGTPGDLARAIATCLAKDPKGRPPDADAFRRALTPEWDSEDEDLPEDIRKLLQLVRGVPLATGVGWYLAYWILMWGDMSTTAGLFAIGAVWSLLPLAARRTLKQTDHSWKSIFKRAFRKPKWWSLWWPRALRSEDDLWDRLPKEARGARVALGWLTVLAFAIMPPVLRIGLGAPSFFWVTVIKPFAAWIVLPSVALGSWPLLRSFFWARRAGLTTDDWERLVAGSERDTRFWKQAHIQGILAPPPPAASSADGGTGLPAPRTPQEYVAALKRVVGELGGAERDIADEGAAAGQEVATAIEALDRQIESLAKDADPVERARLRERLAEFGAVDPAESEGQRRMRALLDEQLVLADSLAGQLDAATKRRTRLMDVLKTLWLQVINLKARAAETAFDSGEITGKIRAIAEDIQRYAEASDETARLLEE